MLKRSLPALIVLAAGAAIWLAVRPVPREESLAVQDLSALKRAASAPDADTLTHLAYGERLARINQVQAALKEFQTANRMLDSLRPDPFAERVYARLAYTLAYMGDLEAAHSYLERARRLNADDWLVLLTEGVILVHNHDARQAIARCRRAAATRPQSYEAHYMLGLAYNDGKDAKAAEVELKRAVALAPDFAPAQAELGHAYAYQSQYVSAAEQFRIARRLDPQGTDYLFALGEAVGMEARSLDQYREAAAVQDECLRASPSNPALLFTLGQLHLRFMNLGQAYDCLRKASALRPKHAKTWLNLARVAELMGDRREARSDYVQFERQVSLHNNTVLAEKKATAYPKDARARLELARRFHAEGNLKGSYVQLRAALSIDPGLTEAHADLGLLQAEFQRLLDQNGSMAAKMEESNPTGPAGPDEALSSETEKSGGPER